MANFLISPINSTAAVSSLFYGDTTGLSEIKVNAIGDPRAFGVFNDDPFDLKSGIVLSTGRVSDLNGVNLEDGGFQKSSSSKSDLNTDFAPVETSNDPGTDGDSITLQIDFNSDGTKDKLYFQYVFGSEELLEFGGSQFNDEFSLELNNNSLAKLSNGELVTINNLAKTPFGPYSSDLKKNLVSDGAVRDQTRLDGYTVPLTFVGNLQEGKNTLIINVTDVEDGQYDSAVFLKAKTFGTTPPAGTPPIPPDGTPPDGTPPDGTPPGKPGLEPGNTIRIPGTSAQSANLLFTLKGIDATFINEVGLFKVNDDKGGLDLDGDGQSDLFPNSKDYTQAVLEQGKVIFSALPKGSIANATRILDFKGSDRLAFYLVQNSPTDEVLRGVTPASRVFFGSTFGQGAQQLQIEQPALSDPLTLKWEDGTNGGDRDFNDMVLTVQSTNQTPPKGTRLQGLPQGELLDLRGVDLNRDGQADSLIRANLEVSYAAAQDNFAGLYRVDNSNGLIDNLLPGDPGYAAAAIKRTVVRFKQGSDSVSLSGDNLGLLAPYIISNGTPEKFLQQNPDNRTGSNPKAYFNYLGANSDKADHIRLLGDNAFGFENSVDRKSFNFNDIVVRVQLSPVE